MPVIFLQTYMQICRGTATDLELFLGLQILHTHTVIVCDRLLNHFDRDRSFVGAENLAQRFLGERQRDFRSLKRAVGNQPDEGAFQFTNVRFDLAGNVERDIVRQNSMFCRSAFFVIMAIFVSRSGG